VTKNRGRSEIALVRGLTARGRIVPFARLEPARIVPVRGLTGEQFVPVRGLTTRTRIVPVRGLTGYCARTADPRSEKSEVSGLPERYPPAAKKCPGGAQTPRGMDDTYQRRWRRDRG